MSSGVQITVLVGTIVFAVLGGFWLGRGKKKVRECFHHDRAGWSKGEEGDSTSWVREELIDLGRRKLYECDPTRGGCGKLWFS